MSSRLSLSGRLVPVLLVAAALPCLGCAAGATFSVPRPAMINAQPYGGTMMVAPFGGPPEAAAAVTYELRERILASEGGAVRLVEIGGGLIVHGAVTDYTYDEELSESHRVCTRSVVVEGQTIEQSYPCTDYTRNGLARVEIVFAVTVAATGETVVAVDYDDSMSAVRSATDETPAFIDGGGMLADLRAGLTERFARIILPWRESVHVHFARCGPAREQCDQGIIAARQGDFATSVAAFRAAGAQLEATGQPNPRHLSQVYWNLGLALEYGGDFQGSVEALLRAAQLDPENRHVGPELRNVQQMAQDAQQLVEQGVAPPPPPPSGAAPPPPPPAPPPAPPAAQ